MPNPHRSARAALRMATSDDHARLDAHFAGGLATAEDYRVYLAGLHALVRDAGDALAAAAPSAGWRRWPQGERLAWLRDDLAWHGLAALPAAPFAPLAGDAAAAGLLYVLEGSTLGARLLAGDAALLGHGAGTGAEFLSHHTGEGSARRWRDFVATLDATGFTGAAETAMVAAAATTFSHAEAAFRRARNQMEMQLAWTD